MDKTIQIFQKRSRNDAIRALNRFIVSVLPEILSRPNATTDSSSAELIGVIDNLVEDSLTELGCTLSSFPTPVRKEVKEEGKNDG